ncbi:nuclear transport factor 2 family protein [Embleya hyalina]|nr:nuclear transport factor 2 family protein [Embleya hyalina]
MDKASADLVAFAGQWIVRAHARDVDFIEKASYSADDAAVHTIASGPDSSLSLAALLGHLADFPPREVVDLDLDGWAHDGVAWLCGTGRVDMLEDGFLDVRLTMVLLRAGDGWKVAHCHISEGVPHEV